MEIKKLEEVANVQIVVSLADLRDYFSELQGKGKEEPSNENGLISIDEAKKRPAISSSDTTLWRWDRIGYLPKVKVGSKVFYRIADIERIEKGA